MFAFIGNRSNKVKKYSAGVDRWAHIRQGGQGSSKES
jgi:hypothetical protein